MKYLLSALIIVSAALLVLLSPLLVAISLTLTAKLLWSYFAG